MNKKIKKIINKKTKSKIICLTAYSKNIAEEVDNFADITLVGDSLGSVLYNYYTTRKVTLTNMIEHSKSVKMGIITDIKQELRKANSLKINYSTRKGTY